MINKIFLIFISILSVPTYAEVNCLEKTVTITDGATGNLNQLAEIIKKSEYLINREVMLKKNENNIHDLISKKNIIGVELIIADQRPDRLESKWGHAMLRFVDDDGDWRNDYVVSFVLDQTDEDMKVGKAIFGGYQILPETKTLGEFWAAYSYAEERNLNRYIISTDPEMRKSLINKFKERSQSPETMGSYTFFSNNCAGSLSKLLIDAGFPHKGKSSIPTSMHNWLGESLIGNYPALIVGPPAKTIKKVSNLLGVKEEDIDLEKSWDNENIEKVMDQLTNTELQQLYYVKPNLPESLSDRIIEKSQKEDEVSMSEIFGFKDVPKELYNTCDNKACVSTNEVMAAKIFESEKLEEVKMQRRLTYFKTFYRKTGMAMLSNEVQNVSQVQDLRKIDINNYELSTYKDKDLYRSPKSVDFFKDLIENDETAKELFNLK